MNALSKRPVKLLALDLDGTALRSNNTLSPTVAAAIEAAAESGLEIVAASGRPFRSMPDSVLSLKGVNYVISSNGAAIHDKTGARIHETLMNEADVLQLLDITQDVDLIWEAFTRGETCTDNRYLADPVKFGCSPAYIGYVKSSRSGSDDMRGFICQNRRVLDSVEYVCPDKTLREAVRAKIEAAASGLYITSSSANFVEFMDKNATKSNALQWLCRYLNIDRAHTAACGNADNDADMLAFAGQGAAVANASALCKAAADLIIPSNDSDGVASFIQKILNNYI